MYKFRLIAKEKKFSRGQQDTREIIIQSGVFRHSNFSDICYTSLFRIFNHLSKYKDSRASFQQFRIFCQDWDI